jgi:hypothetical protein
MATLIQWTEDGETVGLEIDVTPTEGYESTAEVTEHPVETGSAIGDHVRPGNPTITLTGMITNSPVRVPTTQTRGLARAAGNVELRVGGEIQRVTLQRWSGPLDRVRGCDALFAALVENGTVVSLTTSFRVSDDLVITRYKVDREATTGDALPVTLELKKVRVVSTARVAVPAVRRLQPVEPRGPQPGVEAGSTLYNTFVR